MSDRRPSLRPLAEGGGRAGSAVVAPRLARHVIRLDDGHQVGVAVAGRGVPFVVVHGLTAEGFLYAQTLSRLVAMGFKVVAVDTAGHGGTAGLSGAGLDLADYAELLDRVVRCLGIRRAVFAGHSMGGRLVAELVAHRPERGIAVLLVNAIVGDSWDQITALYRMAPPLLGLTGVVLLADTASTLPVMRNPRQAVKLVRLLLPTLLGHARHPLRMVGPVLSILRSAPSAWVLDRLARVGVPVVVVHGDRDCAIPLRTARDAAARADGTLVVVHGGTHSWLLKDPETLPAIVAGQLTGELGQARARALADAGLDPSRAGWRDVEGALYDPDALVLDLTPHLAFEPTGALRHRPRYRWTVTHPGR